MSKKCDKDEQILKSIEVIGKKHFNIKVIVMCVLGFGYLKKLKFNIKYLLDEEKKANSFNQICMVVTEH